MHLERRRLAGRYDVKLVSLQRGPVTSDTGILLEAEKGLSTLTRLHYPLDVILLCVRWYGAYSPSLRNLEEMMAERGFEVDHSSVHRWVIKLVP